MSARPDIENALHRWCWGMDERDLELVRDCWTEDASMHVDLPGRDPLDVAGREAILARLQNAWAENPPTAMVKHVITTVYVEEESSEEARVRSYVVSFGLDDGRPALFSLGRHRDRLVLQDGIWRLRERTQTIDGWKR